MILPTRGTAVDLQTSFRPMALASRRLATTAARLKRNTGVASQGGLPFDGFVTRPTKSKMELFNAWSLARASQLAYTKESEVHRTVEEWGFKLVRTFGFSADSEEDEISTQAFVTADDEIVLASFRGTERKNLRDWLVNVDKFLEEGPFGADVHGGFLKALKAPWKGTTILDTVVNEVGDLSREGRALYLTGHSLGAALATLAAGYMLEKSIPVTGVYTYGSPRPGSANFATLFNKQGRALTHRIFNRQDVVPHFPLEAGGYSHVGTSWYISANDEVTHPDRLKHLWGSFTPRIDGEPDQLVDHRIQEYIDSLRRALDNASIRQGANGR